jgi:hypothetical protein
MNETRHRQAMTALTSLGVDVDAALDYGNYGRSRRPLGIEYIYICIILYLYISQPPKKK